MFEIKATSKDNVWKQVEYVQSCVKDATGIGKSKIVQFFAPLVETDIAHDLEIDFDHRALGSDL